ncbi:MAG: pectate lyase [Prevotella sp.]|jgi:pectate lyase
MSRIILLFTVMMFSCFCSLSTNAAGIKIKEARGWLESAFVTWTPMQGAEGYHVYIKGGENHSFTKIDTELVRDYGNYFRADAVGLKPADNYTIRVVPVVNGREMTNEAQEISDIDVHSYQRSGFCFMGQEMPGAYKADGTLKDSAIVIYVKASNAKTVTMSIITSNKGYETCSGLQNILAKLGKRLDNRPVAIRILGCILNTDLDKMGSASEGLQLKGPNNSHPMNLTIEGIGQDACFKGFGLLVRNASYVEIRNLGLLHFMDDGLSINTNNQYCWLHNLDVFYGLKGVDADQVKGDGSIDVKANSQHITISSVHFWDSGKCSLCGMKNETGPNYISYDHNWFDHADSRMPRVRTMSVHIWNNYYDGVSKYGAGATYGASLFVENNYFRGTKYPTLISEQGNGIGKFSGETGGMIKTFGNIYAERPKHFAHITYQENPKEFDSYEAAERNEKVPSTIKAKAGGSHFDNFDTNSAVMYSYKPLPAAKVPEEVTGWYGAGRMGKGDITFKFSNLEDNNHNVNEALQDMLSNYTGKRF